MPRPFQEILLRIVDLEDINGLTRETKNQTQVLATFIVGKLDLPILEFRFFSFFNGCQQRDPS